VPGSLVGDCHATRHQARSTVTALLEVALFLVSLALTLTAAAFFARRLDRVGLQLGLPETLLGLLTALAADAPELSSAVTALVKGNHGVGVGVVVGSNVFNLAAMIGLTAIVAGHIRVRREALAVEGMVGLAITLVVAALVTGMVGPTTAIAIIAFVLSPYLLLLGVGPTRIEHLPLAQRPRRFLRRSFGAEHRPAQPLPHHGEAILRPVLLLLPAVAIIVAGAVGMVETALRLSDRLEIPSYVTGVLVLAVLTSLPNAFTAVRLGLHGRGSAVLSETLNSNTINLVAGVAIPALLLTLGDFSGLVAFDLVWMIGMTVAALALLARPRGVGPAAGAFLVALFLVFAGVQVVAG
jgi:cation:H+ antiporter